MPLDCGCRLEADLCDSLEAGGKGFAERAAGVLSQLSDINTARHLLYPQVIGMPSACTNNVINTHSACNQLMSAACSARSSRSATASA